MDINPVFKWGRLQSTYRNVINFIMYVRCVYYHKSSFHEYILFFYFYFYNYPVQWREYIMETVYWESSSNLC